MSSPQCVSLIYMKSKKKKQNPHAKKRNQTPNTPHQEPHHQLNNTQWKSSSDKHELTPIENHTSTPIENRIFPTTRENHNWTKTREKLDELQIISKSNKLDQDGYIVLKTFFDSVYRNSAYGIRKFIESGGDVNRVVPDDVKWKRYRKMPSTVGWAAIHFAAFLDMPDLVLLLVSLGADVECRNKWKQTPLHIACVRGNESVVKVLLDAGADCDAVNPYRFNQTPLGAACVSGKSLGCVELLLNAGADSQVTCDNPSEPDDAIYYAIKLGHTSIATHLYSMGCYATEDDILELAAIYNRMDFFSTILTDQVSLSPTLASNIINIDIRRNTSDFVEFLLDSGKAGVVHPTALSNAIGSNRKSLVSKLIGHMDEKSIIRGASILTAVKTQDLELVKIVDSIPGVNKSEIDYYFGNSAAHHAVLDQNLDILMYLKESGYKLRTNNRNNDTPLHLSCLNGNSEITKLLLENTSIKKYEPNNNDKLPIHIAAENGHAQIIELFIENDGDINAVTNLGISPLHFAAMNGHEEVVSVLCSAGADVNLKKRVKIGPSTAIQMARSSCYMDIVQILRNFGAHDDHQESNHGFDTKVSLLKFNDELPQEYNYPKNYERNKNLIQLDTSNLHMRSDDIVSKIDNKNNNTWHTLRLFISSTFLDMSAERDYLVKWIIPQLKKQFSEHRIHIIDVDLRWGVTQKEAESGNSVQICLNEVENCDIFIALLGDRYGWVPDRHQIRDDIKIKYSWKEGMSITAMEISTAISNKKCTPIFFLRDEHFSDSIPDSYKGTYIDSQYSNDMKRLKYELQKTEYVVEEYSPSCKALPNGELKISNLDSFGDSVRDHVSQIIEDKFIVSFGEKNDYEEENFFHEEFIEYRSANFIGRSAQVDSVISYIESKSKTPLVVGGVAGTGKSALMCHLTKLCKENRYYHVISHFVGASPKSTDAQNMLFRICKELITEFSLWDEIEENQDISELSELFVKLISDISSQLGLSSKAIIFIDALNQLSNKYNSQELHWLPKVLPQNVRIIVSCLPGRCLDILDLRKTERLDIGMLASGDKLDIIEKTLYRYNKRLSHEQTEILLEKEDSTKPLFLIVACEELRLFGKFEELTNKVRQLSSTLTGLLDQVLQRLENEHGAKLVKDTLCLLECSKYGLLENEIIDLLSLTSTKWGGLNLSLELFLRRIGTEGQFDFFHRQIAKAVQRRYLSESVETHYHNVLTEYFHQKADLGIDIDTEDFIEPSPRAINEITYHCYKSLNYDVFVSLLTDLKYLYRRSLNGDIYNLVEDMNEASKIGFTIPDKYQDFQKYIQTYASTFHQNPFSVFQTAVTQYFSRSVYNAGIKILHGSKFNWIQWHDKPDYKKLNDYDFVMEGSDAVNEVNYSPDGRYIISCHKDGSTVLWDSSTGKEYMKFYDHTDIARGCCFSHRGDFFITVGEDMMLNIYQNYQLYQSITLPSPGLCCAISPDDDCIAVGMDNGSVTIYNAVDLSCVFSKKCHSGSVTCLKFLEESKIVSGSVDKMIYLWDTETGKEIRSFSGHSKVVKSLDVHKSAMISSSQDKSIIVWDIQSGDIKHTLKAHNDNVEAVAFSGDGRYMLSASWDRTVKLWNDYEVINTLPDVSHFFNSVRFSPDGKSMIVGSPDFRIKKYNFDLFKTKEDDTANKARVHSKIIRGMYYSSLRNQILTASWDRLIKVHNTNLYQNSIKTVAVLKGHSRRVNAAKFSHNGEFIISASMDNTIRIWDSLDYDVLVSLRGHEHNIFSLDISHDDKYIVSGAGDGTVRVWSIESGDPLGILEGHSDWVTAVAFSPYSRRILSGSRDASLCVWESETGEQLECIQNAHNNCILDIKFSPDGKYFATASEDRTIKIWSAFTLKVEKVLTGHAHEVTTCAWLSDNILVTGSSDKTTRFWNVSSATEIATFYCEGGVLGVETNISDKKAKRLIAFIGDSTGILYMVELKLNR
eukprot:TRINITY_DN1762_c0_g1_i2.p1 TRINITY_DN1762_c0_g1~~TRINITY_DN1762_c0_g1_i2.p1  ORF type:complete len:1949 (-),score=386.28 TRINITY_DN1762_c0_g1_i2:5-5851(-)